MSTIFHEPNFWVAVSFVLFFLLFGKKLWLPIARALDNRAELVRRELDEVAALRRQAEQMLENAIQEREQALVEARSLIERSRQQAIEMTAHVRKQAEETIRHHEKVARDRIMAAERAAIKEVHKIVLDVTFEAAQKVIPDVIDNQATTTLINQAIAKLPEAITRQVA